MPVTLSKLTSNTAMVTMPYGEDTVQIVYYPGKITEKTIAQLQGYTNVGADRFADTVLEVNVLLAGLPSLPGTGLIKSWDVYEDDAQTVMFPLDANRLPELPFLFRTSVIVAIMQDVRPEASAP